MSNVSNSTCSLFATESSTRMVKQIGTIAYLWIWPICLCFDFVGHGISFLAFYKESKTNGIYAFQLLEAVAKATDTLTAFLNMLCWKWCALNDYWGANWFQENYILMWYTAHAAIPFNDMTTTIAMLISLAMTVDRAISIGMPVKYKLINKKKWQIASVSTSILIGITSSVYMCFFWDVGVTDTGRYSLPFNAKVASSQLASILANIRNVIWMCGLVGVVTSGFTIVYLYRKQTTKVAFMTGGLAEDRREIRRKAAEKTLFKVTIFYSIQTANVMFVLMAHSLFALKDGFTSCEQKLFGPLRAIEISVVNASDFYVMLIMSEAFRKMIRGALPFKEKTAASVSAPVLHM